MAFAPVFFLHSCTSDVVPLSAVPHGYVVGDVTKVRWESRSYKAKIIFIGRKEICELKPSSVTADGELLEDVFDVSPLEATERERESNRKDSREEAVADTDMEAIRRENTIQLIAIKENLSLIMGVVKNL
ncbi:unnamed protein product [Heligmosomoides polygyrus]|uniref:Tudor domain-containing protein n=1 Tax=Heligmosomoides polygyrus TaxID=6339 RepID=A0A183FLE5_HELPZ|nr:unnamed protein product [Heligmosomoides polygyrus]